MQLFVGLSGLVMVISYNSHCLYCIVTFMANSLETGKQATARAVTSEKFRAAVRINHFPHTMKCKLLYRKLMKQEWGGHTRTGKQDKTGQPE